MSNMLSGCKSLKNLPDISKWDTKNATDMSRMFYHFDSLNNFPDFFKLDIKNVTNMDNMFDGCKNIPAFNIFPLSMPLE